MRALDETLSERAGTSVESHRRRPFLSTMGTQAAIDELIARNEELERAVGRLTVEVERLSALQEERATRY